MFSAGQAAHVAVLANDASICPVAHAATIAQILIVNRKELRIYAQRGALNFSYHVETEMVPEGTAYGVLLDPSEKEIELPAESGQDRNPPAKVHAKFQLPTIAIVPVD